MWFAEGPCGAPPSLGGWMHDGTGDAAGLLRRAERHLDRARAAGADADLALSAAWLASRYALLAVLRVEGIELEDTAAATVTAYARAVLPAGPAAAAAALEEAAAADEPGADPAAHAV